jgi:hypothetical protein
MAACSEEDGGTLVVPGFHRVFADWVKALGPVEGHLSAYLNSQGGGQNWLVPREGGGGSYHLRVMSIQTGILN